MSTAAPGNTPSFEPIHSGQTSESTLISASIIHANSACWVWKCAIVPRILSIVFAVTTGDAEWWAAFVPETAHQGCHCRGFVRTTNALPRIATRLETSCTATVSIIDAEWEAASRDEYSTQSSTIVASITNVVSSKTASSTASNVQTAVFGTFANSADYSDFRCTYKGCDKLTIPGTRCCAVHKCTFEGCVNFRDNETDKERVFCRDHGCGASRCYAVAVAIDGGGFRPFCRRHTCTAAGCIEVAEFGVHCHKHRCHWKSCEKPCLAGGEYCGDHECKRAGCRKIAKLQFGYCADHCCKIDNCINYCDVTADRICYEHSRGDLFDRIKHLEKRLRERQHEHIHEHHEHHHPHFDDLQIRQDKLIRDYDECLLRLNESREEIRVLRSTWISADENRIWRKDLEDRNARLLLDLDRELKRSEHWERKAIEFGRRIDDLEVLLAEERLRHPKSDEYVRQIADLVRKVEILEDELRIERNNHHIHQGRQHEIEKLVRTIEELERKLKGDHIKVDELIKKVDLLQSILAGEREQKDILLSELAKRDEYERLRRDERRRPRRGSWERRSRDSRPWGSVF
ncbi:hypothetical protein CORC01_09669 [Colletotrichum orchidophilum]|uniref:Uncharacterized protein n=1 Tax=Colletotrichum orchidophilum TaxID=1209926 RepID=A0A1G4B127_9PEZI|nr:uncharacterized protein CORC01_09669 [Colletotrichum orchidophilum]OHE95012.1 hypothetical protein CORC01_09669 [Colletotrichum orchidophilum]